MGNYQQLSDFTLLETDQLDSTFKQSLTVDSSLIQSGSFLQLEIVQDGITSVAPPIQIGEGQIRLDSDNDPFLGLDTTTQNATTNAMVGDADAVNLSVQTGAMSMAFTVYIEANYDSVLGFYTTDAAIGCIVTDALRVLLCVRVMRTIRKRPLPDS